MKQIIQFFKAGDLTISDVPTPVVNFPRILRNSASLVLPETERMLVEFAEKDFLQKSSLPARFGAPDSRQGAR